MSVVFEIARMVFSGGYALYWKLAYNLASIDVYISGIRVRVGRFLWPSSPFTNVQWILIVDMLSWRIVALL